MNKLDKTFQKVVATPAGFGFFVAIHDFVDCIESDVTLSKNLSSRNKINKETNIAAKYDSLKQIYQGIKDAEAASVHDLGHDRNTAIRDLVRIKNKETSENNFYWRKRELFKKLSQEVYERLTTQTV